MGSKVVHPHVQREKFVFLYEYIARRNGIIMYVRAFVPGTGLGRRLDAGGLTLGTGQHTWWSSVQRMDRFGLVCSNMILLCKWRPQLCPSIFPISHVLCKSWPRYSMPYINYHQHPLCYLPHNGPLQLPPQTGS